MNIIDAVDAASLRTDVPEFGPGDTVKVHVNIIEGSRSRVQVFQGVVIRIQGSGIGRTFTVRKVSELNNVCSKLRTVNGAGAVHRGKS